MNIFISIPNDSIDNNHVNDEGCSILSEYNLECLSKLIIHDRLNKIANYRHHFEHIKEIQFTDIGHIVNERSRFSLTAINKEKFVLISYGNTGIKWSTFFHYLPLKLQTHYLLNAFEEIMTRFLSIEDKFVSFYRFSEYNITFNEKTYSSCLGQFSDAFVVDKIEDVSYRSQIIPDTDTDLPFELFILLQHNKLSCTQAVNKYIEQCHFTQSHTLEQRTVFKEKLTQSFYQLFEGEGDYIIRCVKGWKTWNLFFLSSFYIKIIHAFIESHGFLHPFWNDWLILLEKNYSPDTSERYNIHEMLNHFQTLKSTVTRWHDVFH
jgi:hypothetical protein